MFNLIRKSEVSDLKSQLRQLAGSRAPGADDSKRDLFKKVISNMTIGIDVSSLFGEMVMCSATSDIVLKKMCYLYVGNYAKVNPDLALLTINFLQRDCKDEDPMIRGLALRSLCSLRVANLVEYLVGPLGSGLKDNNSYVRMVAVIGVLKLYHISASTCIDADFLATLKHLMLNDPDTQVRIPFFMEISFSTYDKSYQCCLNFVKNQEFHLENQANLNCPIINELQANRLFKNKKIIVLDLDLVSFIPFLFSK